MALGSSGRISPDPARTASEWFLITAAVSPLLVAVLEVPKFTILQHNTVMATAFGVEDGALIGTSIEQITQPEDRSAVDRRLSTLTDGAVTSFRVTRSFLRPDGSTFEADVGIQALGDEEGNVRFLLVEAAMLSGPGHAEQQARHLLDTLGPLLDRSCESVAVLDLDTWTCRCTSAPCLAEPPTPGTITEHSLPEIVDPQDWGRVTSFLERTRELDETSERCNYRAGASSQRRSMELHVRPWPRRPNLLTALVRDVDCVQSQGRQSAGRVHELEEVLVQIARSALEVLGVPSGEPVGAGRNELLDVLSRREREVVLLLLRGQRVPSIANQLYISPSTVRNHLSRVFKKVGVRTQAELLERFAGRE